MFRPQIVFHAGADQARPLMEMKSGRGGLNNVVGTKKRARGLERLPRRARRLHLDRQA